MLLTQRARRVDEGVGVSVSIEVDVAVALAETVPLEVADGRVLTDVEPLAKAAPLVVAVGFAGGEARLLADEEAPEVEDNVGTPAQLEVGNEDWARNMLIDDVGDGITALADTLADAEADAGVLDEDVLMGQMLQLTAPEIAHELSAGFCT